MADLQPGDKLGRFRIVARLGAGGMGVVYRGRDDELQRDVALKILPEGSGADALARARLLREARSAAALSHPNICPVFDVGHQGGVDYIAMELIDGHSLDEVIGGAAMQPAMAVRIGREIADALAHAHERGVAHRDLKGSNVMLSGAGSVKVLDFGLARRIATADSNTASVGGVPLTEAGSVVGTVYYLSPEVVSGAEADERSDIWALGVMLHQMFARELPFQGRTAYEVTAAILNSPPRALPDSVPAGIRTVITRCLEKDPVQRYQRAGDVRAALEVAGALLGSSPSGSSQPSRTGQGRRSGWRSDRRVAVVAVLLVTVVLVGAELWRRGQMVGAGHPAGGEPIRSLAVLPLENRSGDPEQAYFSTGMTEEISTRLARVSALRVVAQASVQGLARNEHSLAAIGRALRVPAVLRGSVVRESSRVRVTAQLVRTATGEIVWAQSYDRDMRDVLALQAAVALAIAHEIEVQLTPQEESRLTSSSPVNPEAYESCLRGRAAWARFTYEGLTESERLFRHAIELEPAYAPAWAGLADAAYGMSNQFVAPSEAIPRARAAAEKALSLDPSLSEAHTSIGIIRMVYDWDWGGAERAFDRAVQLRPGDPYAHSWRATMLVYRGRFEEGLEEGRRARDLDPLSPWISVVCGWHLLMARRDRESVDHVRNVVALNPGYQLAHVVLGLGLEQVGARAEAVTELEQAMAAEVNNDGLGQLAHAYGTAGRRKDAERVIAQLLERRHQRFVPSYSLVLAHAGLGNMDQAFHWLELAMDDHSEGVAMLGVDRGLDPMRADPRFASFLHRAGLAP